MLSLFHVHYGRWVKFAEDITTETLLSQVRTSPLLLCSICLIAVRHTTQELADELAPSLFEEAKRLLAPALLTVPQSIDFFQAVLVLSLWSTTIGQTPLNVDSWLLTGYALQLSLASPRFSEVLRSGSPPSGDKAQFDAWCIWNHLCVAHLQYCVGTRRPAIVNQQLVDRCLHLLECDNVTNFETRMVAEAKLYWIIYEKCCGPQIDLSDAKTALQDWKEGWAALFDQPRAQFLQMGFHFAHLVALYNSLKSARAVMRSSVLGEMIRLSTAIINLAMDTTDQRTRHLTDHIYHIITFSAITLCRLLHNYESKLRASHHDVAALDHLVVKLVNWLQSIGLPCHVAHIFGDIVSAQHKKLRPTYSSVRPTSNNSFGEMVGGERTLDNPQTLSNDVAFLYPDFIGSELFNMDPDTNLWPQWDQMLSDTDLSV